jgi:hypothetical protein
MNRHIRPLSVLCAAIITVLTIIPVSAATPDVTALSHWHGCFGTTCRGRDPQLMGCAADAVTLALLPHPGTASAGSYENVELRYSAACNARWARVTSRLSPADILFTTAFIAGHPSTRVTRHGTRVVWSRMWSGSVRACGVSVLASDPSYAPILCAP